MESPESSKPVTTETAPAQESPIFSYISKFSPVHPANAPTVTQGFPGINSPPHVFTSPQLKFRSHTTFLKRAIFHGLSATTRQITKGSDVNTSANEQIESPTECPDQFFTDGMNMDSIDSNSSSGSTVKPSEYVDQPPDATGAKESSVKFDDEDIKTIIEEIAIVPPALTRQTDDVHKEDSTIYATEIETNIKYMDGTSDQCTKIEPDSSVGHALTNQELDEPITEEEKAGQGFPLDQSSHMLSGSVQVVEDSEHFVEAIGATLAKPALEEAFQHRGIRRRCLQFEDAGNQLISNHPPQNHEDSTGPQSLERPLPLANEKRDVTSQPVSYPRNNLSSNFMVHGPIGLHLNKMVNYGQSGPGPIENMNPARRTGSFSICGNKLIPIMNSPSDSGLSRTDDNRSLSTFSIKPLNNYVALNSAEDESTPGNKRKCNTIIDGVSEDFKSSAKKKMKSSDPNDGNGCKRCNCKKSNCLKLPQYEETVLDKRQQIESRNPLAFAPKVVKHLIQPPASSFEDDQTQFTPSSARHKRGCNCKKSMCVKRYCECYQANVGCSDGCRCEGCQNVFGRKGDHGMIKDVANDENTGERTDGSSATKFELLSSGNGLYNPELLNPHNLTPPTPAFQFSDHIKDASAAWFPSGKYFQSPSPDCNNANEIMDLVPFDPELHYDGNIQTTDNDFSAGKMDLLSGISNSQDWANDTNVQSFPVNRQYSSSSSFHWHGSPNTPMALHSGTTKLLEASMQDDTPEILKDAPTPQNNVKVISPAKKRVSPPRLHEFGSRSSGAVRTGRKFILKAVPSFPPLTPCIDSKFVAVVPTYDPQNFSNDK